MKKIIRNVQQFVVGQLEVRTCNKAKITHISRIEHHQMLTLGMLTQNEVVKLQCLMNSRFVKASLVETVLDKDVAAEHGSLSEILQFEGVAVSICSLKFKEYIQTKSLYLKLNAHI